LDYNKRLLLYLWVEDNSDKQQGFDAPKNAYQYQGDYSEFDNETQWDDFELRSYYAQIGRFVQQDPYDQFPSPYTGMGNDPVNNIDPSGGWAATGIFQGLSQAGKMGVTTLAGAIIGAGVDAFTGGDGKGILIGEGLGFGVGLAGSVNWGTLASSNLSKIGITVKVFSATVQGVRIELLYKKPAVTPLTNFHATAGKLPSLECCRRLGFDQRPSMHFKERIANDQLPL